MKLQNDIWSQKQLLIQGSLIEWEAKGHLAFWAGFNEQRSPLRHPMCTKLDIRLHVRMQYHTGTRCFSVSDEAFPME
jgi:hypothetical protein